MHNTVYFILSLYTPKSKFPHFSSFASRRISSVGTPFSIRETVRGEQMYFTYNKQYIVSIKVWFFIMIIQFLPQYFCARKYLSSSQ